MYKKLGKIIKKNFIYNSDSFQSLLFYNWKIPRYIKCIKLKWMLDGNVS